MGSCSPCRACRRNRCEWPQQLPPLPAFGTLRTLILTGCRITWQQAREGRCVLSLCLLLPTAALSLGKGNA